MNADRSQYDELDDAIAQRREQSLLENEIASLQVQVREMERLFSGDIDLLQRHVGRLEHSQNTVLARMDELQTPALPETDTRPYNLAAQEKFKTRWWRRWWSTIKLKLNCGVDHDR